jgi:hypothetical protein
MRHVTRQVSLALVFVLSTMLLGQPASVRAADCSAEKAAVDALGKDISRLADDIQRQLRNEQNAARDMADDLALIDKTQQELAGEAGAVEQELKTKGLWDSLKSLGVQAVLTLLLGAIGPEGWPLVGHTAEAVLEVAEKAHTAVEMFDLLRESAEAASMMDDLAGQQGSLEEAQAFADKYDLPELQLMLTHLEDLAAQAKAFDLHQKDLKNAAHALAGDQALMAKLAKQLEAALEALYACLDQPGPIPSPCDGQATNPNGAGVCR